MTPDELGYTETVELLGRLGPALVQNVVLVGGQAVNLWVEQYLPRSSWLTEKAPFTSKDIDFCGSARLAMACATALGGRCTVPRLDDMTPCTGVVEYTDQFARVRTLDFLGAPFGLDAREVHDMAIVHEQETPKGVLELRVLHPVHMLESRASNVARLPGYRSPHGLKQLRASVECAREFLRDLLNDGRARDVLRLNERIFRFALRDSGMGVWVSDGVSVFDAVLRDPRLPEAFERVRVPQMMAELAERQSRAEVAAGRSARPALSAPGKAAAGEFEVVAKADGPSGTVWSLRGLDGAVVERVGLMVPEKVPGVGDRVEVDVAGRVFVTRRARDRGR